MLALNGFAQRLRPQNDLALLGILSEGSEEALLDLAMKNIAALVSSKINNAVERLQLCTPRRSRRRGTAS